MLLLRWEHFRIGLRRLDEITSIPHESDDPAARPLRQPVAGRVEFRNVSFHYPDRDRALHEVSFSVQRGECIGLVGASGAGKSTLFSLLLRFDRPQTGSVFIDDADLQFATASSLRSSIAIVPQDILLFDTTIAENVRYGKPEAADEAVHEACRAARADQFIESLPQGYQTIVGERGVKLSGGQRQRIAIARAFLKDAPILLMDEGTASLDSKSEQEIHEAMRMVIARRTTLIIAHRLATVVGLPRILVLDLGRIIDDGNHHDLLERCQIYRTLVETQFISMQREDHKVLG
jgi:ATP-binding cassette subfamily B protein